jgi:hypothetical protein
MWYTIMVQLLCYAVCYSEKQSELDSRLSLLTYLYWYIMEKLDPSRITGRYTCVLVVSIGQAETEYQRTDVHGQMKATKKDFFRQKGQCWVFLITLQAPDDATVSLIARGSDCFC